MTPELTHPFKSDKEETAIYGCLQPQQNEIEITGNGHEP
jgi:hypothetical protein